MNRYWLEFEEPSDNGGPSLVGVTALDLEDALRLVGDAWFEGKPVPRPTAVTEHVDVSTLPEWVRQNMGVPTWRGIWYPISGIAAFPQE